MTEVVPVEPELIGQIQPEPGEQQTSKVDSLQLKRPLMRPDLRVALVSRISPATEGVVQYFCNLARSVSDLCPTVGIANLDREPPPPELDSRLDMHRVWRLNTAQRGASGDNMERLLQTIRLKTISSTEDHTVSCLDADYVGTGKPDHRSFAGIEEHSVK